MATENEVVAMKLFDLSFFILFCSRFRMNRLLAIGNKVKELGLMHVHDMAEWARRPACFMQSSSQGIASAERGGYHIGRSLFPEAECGVRPSLPRILNIVRSNAQRRVHGVDLAAEQEMRAEHNVVTKATKRQFRAAESEDFW